MRRASLCFLFATTLLAAEPRLGPETRVPSPLDIGAAAYNQLQPAVASNGLDFLAVWVDGRSGDGNNLPLYATRLGIDGHPFEQFGTRLAGAAQSPHVASAGGDYLIAFTANGSNVLHVDENGHPLGDVRRLSATRVPQAIASNGANYLLFESPGVIGTILDRDGAPLTMIDATFGSVIWAGAYDGTYVVIDVPAGCDNGCKGAPRLNVISGSGSVVSRVSLPFVPLHNEYLEAVASRDRIVITSHSDLTSNFLVTDYEGRVVRPLTPLPSSAYSSGAQWDGRDFLLLYGPGDFAGVTARRMSPAGELLGDPFFFGSDTTSFASNGTTQMMVWSGGGFGTSYDVIARGADNFEALASAPSDPILVTYSPAAQNDVRVAGGLTVWRDSNGAISGTLNGKQLAIMPRNSYNATNPVIAMGKKNYLVAWRQRATFLQTYYWTVVGRRIAFDGTVLDPTPLTLSNDMFNDSADRPGIAYDGNAFVVAATSHHLYTGRVSEDGVVEERRTINMLNASVIWATPVATASRVLTIHAYKFLSTVPTWSIGVDGNLLIQNAGTGDVMHIAAATDHDRVTLAWMTLEGSTWTIQVAQLNADGQVIVPPRRLRDAGGIPTDAIELAWNGSEYVLGWSDNTGRLHAMRLNRLGEAIDSEPFDIAQQRPFARFSLAPTTSGVTFGFDRVDDASAGVTRAFTRVLDRSVSGPPRRSVRH
jgi:hypothetical protein